MKISMNLSESSILSAVRELETVKENVEQGTRDFVDILTKEGAEIANVAYDGMAQAEPQMIADCTGEIEVSADDFDTDVIAEFGAGDATIGNTFENPIPGIEVYAGEYSEKVGSKDYARYGRWFFGGQMFTEIPARHGLLNAKAYIETNYQDIAKEVIRL